MKVSELVELLESYSPNADVFVRDEVGLLHEFQIEFRPAVFDGFDEAYDEGPNIVLTD